MDPAMADAWSNLGSAYHHENDLEDALGWCVLMQLCCACACAVTSSVPAAGSHLRWLPATPSVYRRAAA